jgi:hypothetical protein
LRGYQTAWKHVVPLEAMVPLAPNDRSLSQERKEPFGPGTPARRRHVALCRLTSNRAAFGVVSDRSWSAPSTDPAGRTTVPPSCSTMLLKLKRDQQLVFDYQQSLPRKRLMRIVIYLPGIPLATELSTRGDEESSGRVQAIGKANSHSRPSGTKRTSAVPCSSNGQRVSISSRPKPFWFGGFAVGPPDSFHNSRT